MKQILNLKPEFNIENPGTFSHASLTINSYHSLGLGKFPLFF